MSITTNIKLGESCNHNIYQAIENCIYRLKDKNFLSKKASELYIQCIQLTLETAIHRCFIEIVEGESRSKVISKAATDCVKFFLKHALIENDPENKSTVTMMIELHMFRAILDLIKNRELVPDKIDA